MSKYLKINCRIFIDEEDDDLKRAIELSLQDQDPNFTANTNTTSETKKRKHDGKLHYSILKYFFGRSGGFLETVRIINFLDVAITEVKEDKKTSSVQDWTDPQYFFRLHRIRGIYPKGNVEALAIQQLITVRTRSASFVNTNAMDI